MIVVKMHGTNCIECLFISGVIAYYILY